jgi:shikimate kinase
VDLSHTSAQDEERLLGRLHFESRARHLARPLALIGFMGAGKSSVGRVIAQEVRRPFFDTDREVKRRSGRSIAEFFAADEEPEFRRLEAQIVHELAQGPPAVLSLGGGALQDPHVRALLSERCLVVHLFVPWAHVRASLPSLARKRPLLQGRSVAEVHELYLRRQWTYRNAHLRIDAPRGSVVSAADLVLSLLYAGHADQRAGG